MCCVCVYVYAHGVLREMFTSPTVYLTFCIATPSPLMPLTKLFLALFGDSVQICSRFYALIRSHRSDPVIHRYTRSPADLSILQM